MKLYMTRAQREAFLAETHVAVVSIPEPGRGPLTAPIWYAYEPGGDILLVMGGTSKKAELIRQAGRMSFCVQTEQPPYQYVSVEGPARVAGTPDFDSLVRPMAIRYLGEQMGELYLETTKEERAGSVLVRLTPERWITVDYHRMAEQAGA